MDAETQDQISVNDLVNKALQAWLDLTGIDVKARSWSVSLGDQFGPNSYELHKCTKDVSASREYDPSGITTFMMLRGLFEAYLQDLKVPCYDLILNPTKVEDALVPMRALRDLLESPQVIEIIEDFQELLRGAALQYGLKGKRLKAFDELMQNKVELAYIRRDALRSIQTLEAHQFLQGAADPMPLKFNPDLYEFWNVNSVLSAMRAQRVAGISLCMIRDPEDAMFSYFLFAIRNGETLTILTDRDDGPHPDYRYMTRRPERQMNDRAERHRFPYELLDLKPSADGKRLFEKVRTALVPMNAEAVALRPLNKFEAGDFVWTVLLFDLIRDKYWKQNVKTPELSYTGQMVVEPTALVGAHGALVRDGIYKPLEMPALTRQDMVAEKLDPQWEDEPIRANHWMVERYGERISEDLLNPVGNEAVKLLEKATVSVGAPRVRGLMQKAEPLELKTLQPTTFGTRETIEKDRLWVARRNQIQVVQRLANEEFEKEKDSVKKWFKERLQANREFLLDAAARCELVLPTLLHPSFERGFKTGQSNAVYRTTHYFEPQFVLGEWSYDKQAWLCCETGKRASVLTMICPNCAAGLAAMLCIPETDLPWPLRHWHTVDPYIGNSILDRIDPEDWDLSNPWKSIRFGVFVAQCKRAIQARRKKLGLPPEVFKNDREE